MTKTIEFVTGIIAVTDLARDLNPDIGSYQEHFYIENFEFIVRLHNGGIKIPRELAKDYERNLDSVNRERIKSVAESYWRS